MSDNPTRLRKYSLADTIVAGAGPNAEKEATAYRVRRYVVASALVAGALYLFRRDRLRRSHGLTRRTPPIIVARMLSGINTTATRALGKYVANHPVGTYVVLAVAGVLAWRYWHKLRRVMRRVLRRGTPADDDDELAAYPNNEHFVEEESEEAAMQAEIAAQQEVDATHEQGAAHLDKSTLYFLQHMSHVTQSMDETATARLLSRLDTVKYPAGTVLFRKGAASNDGMFSVVSGELGVFAEDDLGAGGAASPSIGPVDVSPRPTAGGGHRRGFSFDMALRAQTQRRTLLYTFGVGQTIGENALLSGPDDLRAVTCEAMTNVEALRFDRAMFNWFLDEYPHSIVSFILTTTSRQWRVAYFTLVEFLQLPGAWETAAENSEPGIDADGLAEIERVIAPADIITLSTGECLHRAGEDSDHVCVLLEGRAESILARGDLTQSNEMRPGCIVGGIASIVQLPYLETVQCTQPCRFAQIPRAVFVEFANTPPAAPTPPPSEEGAADTPAASASGGANPAPVDGEDADSSTDDRAAMIVDIALVLAKSMTRLLRLFLEIGCQRLFMSAGDMLYNEDDPADGMYIIISGRLRNLVGDERSKARAKARAKKKKKKKHGRRRRGSLNSQQGRVTSGQVATPSWRAKPASPDEDSEESDQDDDGRMRAPIVALELGRGETVGELSVLNPESKRECSVTVVRESELVRISAAAFDRMTRAHPPLMHLFTNRLASRYQQMHKQLSGYGKLFRRSRAPSSNLVTLALVPAGANPPPLGAFASKLVQALKVEGPVLHLTSKRVDKSMGAGTTARLGSLFERSKVAAWISTQEEAHRFLVFEADAGPTMWTKTCIRQADCVLLVGLGTSSPDLSRVERTFMFSSSASSPAVGGHAAVAGPGGQRPHPSFSVKSRVFCRKELVLLHDPARRPKGTRKWLRSRRVGLHHHVRIPVNGDYERLVRHLVGKARGVVLGGGGARGLAHLGVLATLEEQGVPIDYIGGTSQGAFMAGLYALTMDVQQCIPLSNILANKIGSLSSLLSDFTLPIVSYFSGEAFNEAIQDVFKDTHIEDLWINYFCVTTNITKSTMGVHEAGCLWRHCRASMTVNGLLPPMIMDGDVVVDGGYVNNLPVDTMFDLFNPEVVVAVDVEDKDDDRYEGVENFGDSLSGWWLAWQKFLALLRLARPLKIPKSYDISLRLAYISHAMMLQRLLRNGKHDDSIVYVRPAIQGYGLLDYDKKDEIVQLGVEAARKKIREWRRHRERRSFIRSTGQLASTGNITQSVSMLDLHMRPASDEELYPARVASYRDNAGAGAGAGAGAWSRRRSLNTTMPSHDGGDHGHRSTSFSVRSPASDPGTGHSSSGRRRRRRREPPSPLPLSGQPRMGAVAGVTVDSVLSEDADSAQ